MLQPFSREVSYLDLNFSALAIATLASTIYEVLNEAAYAVRARVAGSLHTCPKAA